MTFCLFHLAVCFVSGSGAKLYNFPTSISQNGNSYTLDVAVTSGTLQPDQVIEVLPATSNSIVDVDGNAASHISN